MTKEAIENIITAFAIEGELQEYIPYGKGHINDTFRLMFRESHNSRYYILQRINRKVFKKPEELMENIVHVTEWLKKKIRESGGDVLRETLNIVPTKSGSAYYEDKTGECWRVYYYIDNTACLEQVSCAEDFYNSALAFGNFQHQLSDFPAKILHETIPDFHNTVKRFQTFVNAVQADVCGRVQKAGPEIQFAMEHEKLSHVLRDLQEQGKLPLRVTHNDTKLNNIMIDNATGKGICVIDLDTVMPGLSVNDFGDSIRFGASTAEEDEQDLSKVSCDLELFEVYVKGFIEGCAGALTEMELEMLPMGAVLMTFECGIRFLTDYLEGDHYFKIHREQHNLDRCRTQFKLVRDMEAKLKRMNEIVKKYS